jgi:hypothetical protein
MQSHEEVGDKYEIIRRLDMTEVTEDFPLDNLFVFQS